MTLSLVTMMSDLESYRNRSGRRLLAIKAADVNAELSKEDWLNPVAMSSLKTATGKRAKTVVLNGITFSLTYGQMIAGEECVKVKRTDGEYVPFGYVNLRRIARFQFEDEDV